MLEHTFTSQTMRPGRIGPLVILLAAFTTIGCDRVTKQIATVALAGLPGRSYVADTIRVSYVENSGGFLSLGESWPPGVRMGVFTVCTALALAMLAAFAWRSRLHGWAALGLTLFVTGGASNWIDRVIHGRVVDFLNVGIGPVRTGVFNVADMAIMAGALVFLVVEFRHRPRNTTS